MQAKNSCDIIILSLKETIMDILILALIPMLSFFISDIIYKYCSQYFGYYTITALAVGFGFIPMVILMVLGQLPIQNLILNYNLFALITVSSIFFLIGYILNFKTLKTEQATNTFALSQIQSIMLILFGILILREQLEFMKIIAIIFLIVGSIFIITNEKLKINKQFGYAAFANISWGIYWFIITIVITTTSANPISSITLARVIAFVFSLIFLVNFITKMKSRQPNPKKISAKKKIIPILFVAAVFDGMGNIFFVLVDKLNNLVLGSIFLAITPALIGIFAYIVFKDRFNKLQLLGLFIIVSAGVLISL